MCICLVRNATLVRNHIISVKQTQCLHSSDLRSMFAKLKRRRLQRVKTRPHYGTNGSKKRQKNKQNAMQFIVQHEGVLAHCAASFLKLSHYFWRCTRVTPFLFRRKDRALNLRVHHLDMNKRLTGH